ncbi:hypothetical protein [Hymenobacter crusticola]|uniref:Uncharacterized protein n=1 Tax=Hymenobacter crusticola TaxID=1770526 RepID=A0A243W647_9BACT|nr:hypothetical protein [Hymenobacter crusticola]OUJ69197.1 hypothetical protein BXP70_26785 [Hymenobacter crusticola]
MPNQLTPNGNSVEPPEVEKLNESLSAEKQEYWAEVIRIISRHEDTLINNRFTWFATLQGLLFAALALMWKEGDVMSSYLAIVLCLLGGIVAYSTLKTIRHADEAHNRLRNWWKQRLPMYTGPGRTGAEVNAPTTWIVEGKAPWNNVPFAFLLVWVLILTGVTYRLTQKKAGITIVTIQTAHAIITTQPVPPIKEATLPLGAAVDTINSHRLKSNQR